MYSRFVARCPNSFNSRKLLFCDQIQQVVSKIDVYFTKDLSPDRRCLPCHLPFRLLVSDPKSCCHFRTLETVRLNLTSLCRVQDAVERKLCLRALECQVVLRYLSLKRSEQCSHSLACGNLSLRSINHIYIYIYIASPNLCQHVTRR